MIQMRPKNEAVKAWSGFGFNKFLYIENISFRRNLMPQNSAVGYNVFNIAFPNTNMSHFCNICRRYSHFKGHSVDQ